MKLDDELCLCFHVTRRKLIQYVRIHRPTVASQLSECFGAGTGCGWCRPYLKQIFERERLVNADDHLSQADDSLPSSDQYALSRAEYRKAKQSKPEDGTPA